MKRDLDSSPASIERPISSPKSHPGKESSRISRYGIPIAAVILLSFAVFFLLRQRSGSKDPIHSLAVLPFKNVNLDPKSEYLSDGITDSIINNLSRVSQLRVMARSTVFAYKNIDTDPREIGKKLDVDAVVSGKLLQRGDDLVVSVDFVDARDGRQIWGDQYNLSHRAPVALAGLGIGYARQGKKQESEKILSELLQKSGNSYLPPFYVACLYANMGRKDEAFAWLEKAYQEHANGLSLLKIIPALDNLRSDPRFTELLKRMNLQ